MKPQQPISGAGLGLRRCFIDQVAGDSPAAIDFYEVAPENWMRIGGRMQRLFRGMTEKVPFVCHGLSLSIGGPVPLNTDFVRELKGFLQQFRIRCYSEHLSYCGDQGYLYDLMPIPFTEEAVGYVAGRIRQVQDMLEQRIAMENISYYAAPGQQLAEIDFINAVLQEADCDLLLDVNNVYVNSINHGYNAKAFIEQLPAERIAYGHIAGHLVEAEDLLVDTHGASVVDPVWHLLDFAFQCHGVFPVLLERDFHLPPLSDLLGEVGHIHQLQQQHQSEPARRLKNG